MNMSRKYLEKVKFLQKIVLINSEGLILALKRTEAKECHSRPGKWDLPGGNVDLSDYTNTQGNDIPTNSILREVSEETGLIASDVRPIYIDGIMMAEQVCVILVGYEAKIINSKVRLSHEHTQYSWVSPSEFLKLDIGIDGEFLYKIVERSNLKHI